MLNRWHALWQQAGAAKSQAHLYHQLIQAYAEKHRAYHTMSHIEHCLNEFDHVKQWIQYPVEVELAIWFHDIIYQPHASANEEKSAAMTVSQLTRAQATAVQIDLVKNLILATKHDRPPDGSDAKYLVDIDISILGAPPEVYRRYEENIRREYRWVPKILFIKGRKKILASFLDRDRIYYTQFFADQYERQSRSNLEAAIQRLK